MSVKIKLGDNELTISIEQAKELIKQLNADEIMDAIEYSKTQINLSTMLTRIFGIYDDKNILHEFFNHKSDASQDFRSIKSGSNGAGVC